MNKSKMTCISMTAMWLVLFIKTIDIPIYWGWDFEIVPIKDLISITNFVSLLSLFLFIASLFWIHQLKHRMKGSPSSLSVRVSSVEYINNDYVNSLSTVITIFSVLIINYDSLRDLMILAVILLVIFLCYSKTNLYYTNAIFALLHYKIAIVKTDNNEALPDGSIVLTKKDIKSGDYIKPHHISENVYFNI